ncbi:MAG: MarR family transcriptional regulator [Sarcina ventriculi]|uniref:MarR family transcriptional regulator n=2 Tax=Sarcina TaxID=1266 RepID=A0ACD1BG11_9CLOT|nr:MULTISPECIES: MarR family transcriptional regulator [Sarcina]MDO4401516.1 MarR family transcriptional regulator [Clostridiaceae bacterium]MBU5322868.1 MarR family transcriptional regulator [Sarcina ventriculi]MCI5636010.1 MarR family transcriptional regulator [Sarcina ventriculi]MDD7372539.1 MarR family transcriptional regulator [Sarcina ventriculi]MDY7061611.1 MarR family transcriptional regulator [Sarcina ventriculi]
MDKFESLKLSNQVCFPLYAASREVIKLYKPFLDEYNLTYTQYITMLVLWEDEKITIKELCKKLYLDSGTITPVIKKLEAMGLLIKYRDKSDERIVNVELTDKGRELKEEIVKVPEQVSCKVNGSMEDLLILKNLLEKVLDEISPNN